MKSLLLILLTLIAISCRGQVTGYTTVNSRYNWGQPGAFSIGINIPSGGNPALASGQWRKSGALYYDSTGTDTGLYVSHGTYWVKVGGVVDANQGLSVSAGVTQLGTLVGSTANKFVSGRFIDLDTSSLYLQNSSRAYIQKIQFQGGDGTTFGARMRFLNGGSIDFRGDSTAGSAISYYHAGSLKLAQGTHMTGSTVDHFYLVDMRNSLPFTSIEIAGVSVMNWLFDGTTQIGLTGSKRIVLGSALTASQALGFLHNSLSTYLADSLSINNILSGTAGDSMLVISSSKVVKKVPENASTSTPALTSVANIASSTAGLFHFIRIGNEISFSGVFSVTPTSGSVTTQIAFALPGTASNFTAANDLSGSGAAFGNTNVVCNIIADATNDRAQVEFLPSGTAAHTIWVSGHYTVK